MDPLKSPYDQLWALFGGRVESESSVNEALNKELMNRWNFSVSIVEKLWWDEEVKVDHDGEEKRFVHLDAICNIAEGNPDPVNQNETLEWVSVNNLREYAINPPTKTLLTRIGYLD